MRRLTQALACSPHDRKIARVELGVGDAPPSPRVIGRLGAALLQDRDPNGDRLLVARPVDAAGLSLTTFAPLTQNRLVVVTNWLARLRDAPGGG